MCYHAQRSFALLALILVLMVMLGCQAGPFGNAATPTPTVSVKVNGPTVVSAEGTVEPIQHAAVALRIAGRVTEVRVTEGTRVKAGDLLIRLDNALLQAQVLQAEAALNVAQKQLEQLRRGATRAQRQAAEAALVSARARYEQVKAGPTQEELAQLKASLDNAEAGLSQAQSRYDRVGGDANPLANMAPEKLALQVAWNTFLAAQAAWRDASTHPTDSELKSAAAAVAQAESNVASVDPTPEAVALAEAQVTQAQTALNTAKTSAQDAVLLAPFAGTVAQVNFSVGDFASPGIPAVVLGDLSKLRVETTDLSEVDVAKVMVGQTAEASLDAFPNQTFHGSVVRIAPLANESRGDKVFRVWIDLQEGIETGLHWGMVANVDITVGALGAQK